MEAAVVLECALVDRQPHQWCGTTMIGDQRQHDGGLRVAIEIRPIERNRDGTAVADDIGHPTFQNGVHIDGWVGKQPINLL